MSATSKSLPLLRTALVRGAAFPQHAERQGFRMMAAALASSRQYSGYVIPSKRNRRPVINGRSIPLHINDLKATSQECQSYSSSPPPQAAVAVSLACFDDDEEDTYQLNNNDVTPACSRSYDSDLVVVLDMDECLIHSQFLTAPGSKYTHQLVNRRAAGANGRCVDSFKISIDSGDTVHVNKRPHLDEFLNAVTSKYETHIFTAAMEIYAKPLLDILDPHNTKFAGRWYRDSCNFDASMGVFVKDLDNLFDSTKRVVLVDNNPLSFLTHPSNGILVSSFFQNPNDVALPAVMEMLEELESVDDVRPVLEQRFRLRNMLDEIQSTGAQQQNSTALGQW